MKNNDFKFGFTLAEVLITLGIIGIVAVLTIPNLVSEYQTRAWNTAASKFESHFGEALRVMNTQQNLANLKTTERFVEELQKQMKVIKVCDNSHLSECFPDIESTYSCTDVVAKKQVSYQGKTKRANSLTDAGSIGQPEWGTNTVGIQFADGIAAILAYNPKCSANPYDNNSIGLSGVGNVTFSTDCVAVVYDTSGYKSPNENHKDIRLSSRADLGSGECLFRAGSRCATKVVPPTFITWNACTETGVSEDAQDKERMERLGIPCTARSNKDYWAGVVEACGGVDKVATQSDLEKLARYLYDSDEISGAKRQSGYTRVASRFEEFGLPSSNFYIWVNTQTWADEGANDFAFANTETGMIGWDWFYKSSGLYGLCVDN